MKVFIDTAETKEIKKWVSYGVIDGVTTNPSIMVKCGVYDFDEGGKAIAKLAGKLPVSLEVTSNDLGEMFLQAKHLASLSPNIVVKIPVINEFGEPTLGVVNKLEREEDIRVNVTAIMSFSQAVMAAKAGATYISIFWGRIGDEGNNAGEIVSETAKFLQRWGMQNEIIVGSIRDVISVQQAIQAGAHIITIPPQFLVKMMDHKYTRDTVNMFVNDAKKAQEQVSLGN